MRWLVPAAHDEPGYYAQTTLFTCGAVAALIAAEGSAAGGFGAGVADRDVELGFWRRASNYPACEPIGLAVALHDHLGDAPVEVALDSEGPVLIENFTGFDRSIRAELQEDSLCQARERGIPVSPIPGPSALAAALSASGLPTDAFVFGGFLPAKSGQRKKELEKWKQTQATLLFYETPHRVLEALEDIATVLGDRTVVLGREITKIHEEFLRGTAAELNVELGKRPSVKGEFVIMIDRQQAPTEFALTVEEAVAELTGRGVAKMDALKQVARERGLSKHDVYQLVEKK